MCWWVDRKEEKRSKDKTVSILHIPDNDSCRNLVVFIFQHYKLTVGEDMSSILSKVPTNFPHTMDHDDRCDFAAIIASIVGENPPEQFNRCILAAAALKNYKPDKKYIENSALLTQMLTIALSLTHRKIDKQYELPIDIKNHIILFAAAITEAINNYQKTGDKNPVGAFSTKYLYAILK